MNIRIEQIANWSPAKRVQTKYGPRDLRTAEASPKFWEVWKSAKQSLKDAGVGCTKKNGEWEITWWQPISEDEQQQLEKAKEASRATDADIDVPCPDGLSYLPYQKAGVSRCLQIFEGKEVSNHRVAGVLIGDEMG